MTAAEYLRWALRESMRANGDPMKSDLAPSEPIAVPLDQQKLRND